MPEPRHRRSLRDRLLPCTTDRSPQEATSLAPPTSRRRTWTTDQVRALGMTTNLETAASILGIGRTLAYELARDGDFPVHLLRLGRRVLVPVPALLRCLGEPEESHGQT